MKKIFFLFFLAIISNLANAQKFFVGYRLGNSVVFDNITNDDFGNFNSKISHEVELGYTLASFKQNYALLIGITYSRFSSEMEDKLFLSQVLNGQSVDNSKYHSDNYGAFIGGRKIIQLQKIGIMPTLKLKYLMTNENLSNSAFQNKSVEFNYFDQILQSEKNNKINLLGKNLMLFDISTSLNYQIGKATFYIEPFYMCKLTNFENEDVRFNLMNYGVGIGILF